MSDAEKTDTQDVDPELTAIRAIMSALSALDAAEKDRVLDYVFRRLGLSHQAATSIAPPAPTVVPGTPAPAILPTPAAIAGGPTGLSDVRSFAAAKQPSNDIERLAVVAYYLAEIGGGEDKKGAITSDDITKYFKQAGFPLPSRPRQTLHNAKNAGYLDAAAEAGSYKLNPVGHNLVVHGLPASGSNAKSKPKKKPVKKSTSR